jgi:MSHA biogenesis protein MshI
VAQALSPLLASGVDVAAVDIPELAQRNLMVRLPGSGSGQALLSLDQTSGLLTVIANSELCFARRIMIPRQDVMEEEDPEHVAMRVAMQIQRSVEVVERQGGLPPVRTVWIGPHPYAALISRLTAEQTGIDCPQLDLQAEVRFAAAAPQLAPEAAAGALLAIGAALRNEHANDRTDEASQSAAPSWLARLKAAA